MMLNNMNNIKVLITGSIGSGKSTVLKILEQLGYKTISCDEINKQILLEPEYLKILQNTFPDCLDNTLDKEHLRNKIANSEEDRVKLNKISHDRILNRMMDIIDENKNEPIFVEVPTFNDVSNISLLFDEVWVIKSTQQVAISRAMKRDNNSLEQITLLYDKTKVNPNLILSSGGMYIIYNNDSYKDLKQKVMDLICLHK